ncbi:hypothetical protein QYM36_014543 [Artemia franciscana]|uniref:Mediator of RNA polymerase II transcription subunit 15 n=1 Tax=Artemia franciscana TaxID=6661 RepID=A0AA88HQE5_ARTSF|nr:hypothetical protein QYM36_014543 [Artemia franciscana]
MGDEWRSAQYRQIFVAKIKEAIQESGKPTTKSFIEIENNLYQKVFCLSFLIKVVFDFNLGFIARVLHHVRNLSFDTPSLVDSMGSDLDRLSLDSGSPTPPSSTVSSAMDISKGLRLPLFTRLSDGPC